MVSAIKAAIGDAVLTFMWVFVSSTLGLVTSAITKALDLHLVSYNGLDYPSIIITTLLIFVLVFIFTIIGNALGGASFNPTGNASFYAAGLGSDTLFSMALRFPAQALGAVGGALAIMEKGVLTFVITFAVLFIMLRGPRSEMVKTWMMAMSTVPLIIAGSTYTGPSMNPALWS
ncbi:Major intrinsic protein [Sesbania bispinosa]|nr:Major intrinsic protein [Sesbania bispinosa]